MTLSKKGQSTPMTKACGCVAPESLPVRVPGLRLPDC